MNKDTRKQAQCPHAKTQEAKPSGPCTASPNFATRRSRTRKPTCDKLEGLTPGLAHALFFG
eukprot:7339861-Prymnesium_polylepis.1